MGAMLWRGDCARKAGGAPVAANADEHLAAARARVGEDVSTRQPVETKGMSADMYGENGAVTYGQNG